MKKINRRKFISIFGAVSFGAFVKASDRSDALEISVNRFDNNQTISLQNTDSIAVKIKEIRIISNNIDYSRDAQLTVSAKVEDFDIGQVLSKSINMQEPETTVGPYSVQIEHEDAFSEDEYDPNKRTLNIYLTFSLDHPSLDNTIKDQITYNLDISPSGELKSHKFNKYVNFETPPDHSLNEARTISGSNLPVLTSKTGFNQLETLISGGMTKDSSSYNIPAGGIDIDEIQFVYSTPKDYQDVSNQREQKSESIGGVDLPVLTSKTGFDQLETLISGGMTKNSSSYDIPAGGIDIDEIQFVYSTPRDYRDVFNSKPDNSKYHLK